MKFGAFLVQRGLVSRETVASALDLQRYRKLRLGRLLVELDQLTQDGLNEAMQAFSDDGIKPSTREIEAKMRDLTDGRLYQEAGLPFRALPFAVSCKQIDFATRRFRDELAVVVESRYGKECRQHIFDAESMDYLESLTANEKQAGRFSNLIVSRTLTDDEKLAVREPFTRIFRDCLNAAVKAKASDIHFEPGEKRYVIRLRVHGDLYELNSLPIIHKEAFTAKVKTLVNLDLAITGEPQDSRASFNEYGTDVRVNSTPTIYGEKIVLRLLDQTRSFELATCGLTQAAASALTTTSGKRDGLVLISGPTGSGKTTLLYSLINSLDRQKKNISTLENPVEYRLPGINQIDVGSRSMTFSSALRALMRQDPDIILVGEIRDQETAELCFKAASTGHLVLSTVHANGASEVVERLVHLGIDRFSIESNLRLSAAQRLVKELCLGCAVKAPVDVIKRLAQCGVTKTSALKVRSEHGCTICGSGVSKGIKGRIPVLEYMHDEHITRFLEGENDRRSLVSEPISVRVIELAQGGIMDANEALEFL